MARYDGERKKQTRDKIVRATARRIRRHGIHASGVAGLMADVGLTVGGFYAHFQSKDELIKEAVIQALAETPGAGPLEGGAFDLAAFIDTYLSEDHRDHPEGGCPIAALLPELLQQPEDSRDAFVRRGEVMIDRIVGALPHSLPPDVRRRRAVVLFCTMIGALQMSRFVSERTKSNEVLDAAREFGRDYVGVPERESKEREHT